MKIKSALYLSLLSLSLNAQEAPQLTAPISEIKEAPAVLKGTAKTSIGVRDVATDRPEVMVTLTPGLIFELDDLGLDASLEVPTSFYRVGYSIGRPALELSHLHNVGDESKLKTFFLTKVPAAYVSEPENSYRTTVYAWSLEPGARLDTSIGRSALRFITQGSIAHFTPQTVSSSTRTYTVQAPLTSRLFLGTEYRKDESSINLGIRLVNSLAPAIISNDHVGGSDDTLEFAALDINGSLPIQKGLQFNGGMSVALLGVSNNNYHVADAMTYDNPNELADIAFNFGLTQEF